MKQVLGETRFAFDVSDEDVIIFGSHGILLCGPNAKKYEPTLVAYLSLTGKDIFVQNLFTRVYITLDSLSKIRHAIVNAHTDPNSISKVRTQLAQESRDVIMFDETLGYAKESLDNMKIPTAPTEKAGKKLFELLDISRLRHELMARVKDMEKNTQCTHNEMSILRQMSVHMKEQRMYKLQKDLNTSTSAVADTIEATSGRSASLGIIQIILAGSLAFAILDRFTGMWTVTNREYAVGFIEGLLNAAFLWMILNILFWVGMAHLLGKYVLYAQGEASKVMDVKMILNQECDVNAMHMFLKEKSITKSDTLEADYGHAQRIRWIEQSKSLWGGTKPEILLEYDERHGFLSYVSMHYNKAEGTFSPKALRDNMMIELLDAGVLREPEPEEGDEEGDRDSKRSSTSVM